MPSATTPDPIPVRTKFKVIIQKKGGPDTTETGVTTVGQQGVGNKEKYVSPITLDAIEGATVIGLLPGNRIHIFDRESLKQLTDLGYDTFLSNFGLKRKDMYEIIRVSDVQDNEATLTAKPFDRNERTDQEKYMHELGSTLAAACGVAGGVAGGVTGGGVGGAALVVAGGVVGGGVVAGVVGAGGAVGAVAGVVAGGGAEAGRAALAVAAVGAGTALAVPLVGAGGAVGAGVVAGGGAIGVIAGVVAGGVVGGVVAGGVVGGIITKSVFNGGVLCRLLNPEHVKDFQDRFNSAAILAVFSSGAKTKQD